LRRQGKKLRQQCNGKKLRQQWNLKAVLFNFRRCHRHPESRFVVFARFSE
jgi:hypothetical protein